jgi:hypothetical protein
VAIKIAVPKAIGRGGQTRAEVALENIQRKCQSFLRKCREWTIKQIYGKWLVAHDVPMMDIVDHMRHTFRCEQHQGYLHYLQYEEAVDDGIFVYSH